MRAPSELSWAALVLSCASVSVVTALAVAAAIRQADARAIAASRTAIAPAQAPPDPSSCSSAPLRDAPALPPPARIVDLCSLSADEIPPALRLDAYFSAARLRAFDHNGVFKGCAHVFAVLDAIHPYLVAFFGDSAWVGASSQSQHATVLKASAARGRDGRFLGDSDNDSDDDDDSDGAHRSRSRSASASATSRRRWRLPECIDPDEATEIVLYPGVDPRAFSPEKIINLDASTASLSSSSSVSASVSSPAKSPRAPPMSPSMRRLSYTRSASADDDADRPRAPRKHIVIRPGALVLGGVFDVSDGSIHIGKHVRIEPGVYIKGPCIIGDHSTLRSGAYVRGDVIIGRHVVLRGELKNAVVLDHAELCHPGYCGDSICGYKSHFGNQVTTANLNLFAGSGETVVEVAGVRFNTGRKKIGLVLGDYSQVGCSSVTDPCTLIQRDTVVYPLTRLRKGIYGPNVIIKNKPLEKGVLEIVPIVARTVVIAAPADSSTGAAAVAEEKTQASTEKQ